MKTHDFTGKTILVTGASSGIGRAAALALSRAGGNLWITGRDEARLKETFRMLERTHGMGHENQAQSEKQSGLQHHPEQQPGSQHHQMFVADLTNDGELRALVEQLPKLNGILHSAGIVGPYPVKFIQQEHIDRMFAINYMVPVNLTGSLLRAKKIERDASVLFMSTIATRNPYFGGALYAGSKAALEAYARTLALEQKNRGIRANCLMAGLVNTPMIESPGEEAMQDEAMERYLQRYPLGVGEPEDVTGAILYFLSDASRWVSGTTLILGGE